MDVAAAMLLLRTEQLLGIELLQLAGKTVLPGNPRTGCLKKEETGEWGLIVLSLLLAAAAAWHLRRMPGRA